MCVHESKKQWVWTKFPNFFFICSVCFYLAHTSSSTLSYTMYAMHAIKKKKKKKHNLRTFILFSMSVHPFNGFNMESLDSENRCNRSCRRTCNRDFWQMLNRLCLWIVATMQNDALNTLTQKHQPQFQPKSLAVICRFYSSNSIMQWTETCFLQLHYQIRIQLYALRFLPPILYYMVVCVCVRSIQIASPISGNVWQKLTANQNSYCKTSSQILQCSTVVLPLLLYRSTP